MSKNNKKTVNKILIILLILVIIVLGVLLALKFYKSKEGQTVNSEINDTNVVDDTIVAQLEPEKKVQIYSGDARPIAVMIDNVGDARPQAGLNDAYVVYEIIVEGGYTRMMAIFKGQDLEQIGPVRSARHYFLDYALENDALYTHFGWSPEAQSDIKKLNVNNINGLIASSSQFWRVKDKAAPHNAVTSTEKILEIANKNGYRTTSNKESVLNYVTDEVTLNEKEDAIIANDVNIPFSTSCKVELKYNEETKKYEKYADGKLQKDWKTGDIISCKNIIITFARNYTLNDGENKGRQELVNVGNLEGYYITNGNAIKITCEKSSRSAKTIYKDLSGNEIDVNDGNTFIEICPIDCEVSLN